MVDVVGLEAGLAGGQGQQVAQGGDDVLVGEDGHGLLGGQAELLVDLVAAHARQVVALGVEQQALEQAAGGVDGGRLARTQAAVDLDEGVLAGEGGVALDGALHDVGVAEQRVDVVVGDGDAEGAQEHRGGLLALAVDGDDELVALIDLELEPGAAGRDDLRLVDLLAAVHLGGVVHAGRADELADDDALGAVDDEGALLGHHGEVAHEHELLLDLAGLRVGEADVGQQRGLVGHVLLAALLDAVRRVAELVLAERHLQNVVLALDGAGLAEGLAQALVHEAGEGLLLHGDEVGQLHRLGDLPEVDAGALCCRDGLCRLLHQVFPPSREKRLVGSPEARTPERASYRNLLV